jgi:hypothetical protein
MDLGHAVGWACLIENHFALIVVLLVDYLF